MSKNELRLAKISKKINGKMENLVDIDLSFKEIRILHKAYAQLGGKLDNYIEKLYKKYEDSDVNFDDDVSTMTETDNIMSLFGIQKNEKK